MKKIIAFVVFFSLIISCTFTGSAVELLENSVKIEQIYSRAPYVKAFVRMNDSYSENSIKGYASNELLTYNGIADFDKTTGVSYIFMVDCSTSVSSGQMSQIKKILKDFISSKGQNDKITIVAFGKTVKVIGDGKSSDDELLFAVDSLKNNQNATVLYDAVTGVKEIADSMDSSYPEKRMAVVFTDAVDYTVGGTTKEELILAAELAGCPIYTVAINPADKKSVDVMGEISRKSGGNVYVATGGNIKKAFDEALLELNGLKLISFMSGSNLVSDKPLTLKIKFGENISAEHRFSSDKWITDNTLPEVKSAEWLNDKSIKIQFSESLQNADRKENYIIKKGGRAFDLTKVLYDENTNSATVYFEKVIGAGKYKISFANVTDNSMEKNPLEGEFVFRVMGLMPILASVKGFFVNSWLGILLILLIVAVLIAILIIRKRKGIIMIDNKATFADNVEYKHTPAKKLPTHYLQLKMQMADGSVTSMDININQSMIFGRASTCEIVIDDANLSRQHFVIEVEGDMLFIQNLSSTNGTLLNGVLLQSKRALQLGDVIEAGQEKFTVSKI